MTSPLKRCAVIGTAQSWVKAPFDDPSIVIKTLNDCYSLNMPRSDEHYDLHPFGQMWFRPKDKRTFVEGEIPDDVYVRPEGHIEWLQRQAVAIPIWLQAEPPEGWSPNAKRFPFEQVRDFLKARPDQDAYIASSPAMIVAHAILDGYKEIHIYGIHLATQGEYVKQRPQFEHLLGRAQAMGIAIVLPEECPLLKHTHVYAYEPEPKRPDREARRKLAKAQAEFQKLYAVLVRWPRWKSKDKELAQLARLKAEMHDAQQQARHALISAGWAA